MEPQLTYNFKAGDLPVAASIYYLHNFAAAGSGDGVSLGATLGETKRPGDWSGFGRYQVIGQDAVFSPVAQDDFPLATNFAGVSAGVSYQLDDHQRLDAWMLTAAKLDPTGPDQYRYHLDWNWDF